METLKQTINQTINPTLVTQLQFPAEDMKNFKTADKKDNTQVVVISALAESRGQQEELTEIADYRKVSLFEQKFNQTGQSDLSIKMRPKSVLESKRSTTPVLKTFDKQISVEINKSHPSPPRNKVNKYALKESDFVKRIDSYNSQFVQGMSKSIKLNKLDQTDVKSSKNSQKSRPRSQLST